MVVTRLEELNALSQEEGAEDITGAQLCIQDQKVARSSRTIVWWLFSDRLNPGQQPLIVALEVALCKLPDRWCGHRCVTSAVALGYISLPAMGYARRKFSLRVFSSGNARSGAYTGAEEALRLFPTGIAVDTHSVARVFVTTGYITIPRLAALLRHSFESAPGWLMSAHLPRGGASFA